MFSVLYQLSLELNLLKETAFLQPSHIRQCKSVDSLKKAQLFACIVQRHGHLKSNKLDIIKSATDSTTSQLSSLINLYFLPCVSIIIRPIVFDPLFETCPNFLKLTLFRSLTFLETDHLIFADGNISGARLLAECMFMSKRVQSLLNFYCFIFSETLNYFKFGTIFDTRISTRGAYLIF